MIANPRRKRKKRLMLAGLGGRTAPSGAALPVPAPVVQRTMPTS